MTTIAWDGRTLAADRQSNAGNIRFRVSKLRKHGAVLVAISGDLDAGEEMADWYISGADPAKFPPAQRDPQRYAPFVVVTRGAVCLYECTPFPILHPPGDLFAIGTGAPFALAAMHCGKTAAEAVEVAAVFDVKTGMGVDALELDR